MAKRSQRDNRLRRLAAVASVKAYAAANPAKGPVISGDGVELFTGQKVYHRTMGALFIEDTCHCAGRDWVVLSGGISIEPPGAFLVKRPVDARRDEY